MKISRPTAQWIRSRPNADHPPRNSVVTRLDDTTMARYSPRKNSANFMDEYSVWYPATNSVSASGRSKGRRFVSA